MPLLPPLRPVEVEYFRNWYRKDRMKLAVHIMFFHVYLSFPMTKDIRIMNSIEFNTEDFRVARIGSSSIPS